MVLIVGSIRQLSISTQVNTYLATDSISVEAARVTGRMPWRSEGKARTLQDGSVLIAVVCSYLWSRDFINDQSVRRPLIVDAITDNDVGFGRHD